MLEGLNPEQCEVALCDTHCLALAGPGSGKTKTNSIKASLLLQKQKRVVAVTFTREAAAELRHRIISIAGDQCKPDLIVGTFHSLAMFQRAGNKSSFGKNIFSNMNIRGNFSADIATEGHRGLYIERALKVVGMDAELDPDEAAVLLEQAKAMSAIGSTVAKNARELLEAYEEILRADRKIDFQDLIAGAVRGMKDSTVPHYATDYLLVDEFQDTDELQYEWIRLHGRMGVKITTVGDDDQSIYGFRSAMGYRGMQQFVKDFDAQTVVLGTNYRCHAEVLDSASRLVQFNVGRMPKRLTAHKGPGGTTEWKLFRKRTEEAEAAVQMAVSALHDKKTVAIIARTNNVLDESEAELISFGIPYVRVSGGSILDKREASIMVDMLGMVCKDHPSGVDGVLSWAGMSENGLRAFRDKFGKAIVVGNSSDMDSIEAEDHEKMLWRSFAKRIHEWKAVAKAGKSALVIAGISHWMLEYAKTDYQKMIIESSANILSKIDVPLAQKAAEMKRRKSGKEITDDVVVLITAHGSKGLEWDTVWIVGANDGTFPDKKSGVEEERRLFYVAMTRARKQLIISSSGTTSPFVHESGVKAVDDIP